MNTADSIALTERVQSIPAAQPFYTDDLMVSGIIVCGLILAMVMSDRKHFLSRLLRSFFLPRENSIENIRTTNVAYMRMGMYIVTFSSVGLMLTAYVSEGSSQTALPSSLLWLLFTISAALLHLFRTSLFAATDRIFMDQATLTAWERSYSNWVILSSIPLYFSAMVTICFDLAPSTILPLLTACIILLELCLLYKAFHIFSGKRHGILQLFLYLCALELIPLFVAGKALVLFVE